MSVAGARNSALPRRLLVTGGVGFVGSHFVMRWLQDRRGSIGNLDKLTYAASPATLRDLDVDANHAFIQGDVADAQCVRAALAQTRPEALIHFAAETHVDRSIEQPDVFMRTNIQGAYVLLDAALDYWRALPGPQRERFRLLNVSTDEVYGEAAPGHAFREGDAFSPNSPYAASKAAAAHLCRAYWRTYSLPVISTFAANNYGPRQFPEKLIPRAILAALAGQPIPLYGDGLQQRDWLHVTDHCLALEAILRDGQPGKCYNIGSSRTQTNKQLLQRLGDQLDDWLKRPGGTTNKLIQAVADRPGHDRRYALNCERLRALGWRPQYDLEIGLRETIEWYGDHPQWLASLQKSDYESRRGLDRKIDEI